MPKALPYYPMYVNDFDEDPDVMDMNLAEVGLYLLCMNESWKRGSIPAEIEKIAIRIRRPVGDVHDAWPGIAQCWVPLNGDTSKLVNPRQELERNKAETISGVRSYVAKTAHPNRTALACAIADASAEQKHTNESVSKSSSKILIKKEDELSPQVKWTIFHTRIKKAGVKFNFRYSEKKQAQEWLSDCEEPFDDILAAVQVFADDAYWASEGHPWNAWPKQFDQFIETARAGGVGEADLGDEAAEDATQPGPSADAPQAAQTPPIDFLEHWNAGVPDAFTEREPRKKVNIDAEFVAAFGKICEVARGIRKNKPDSTWLDFYWLFTTKPEFTRPNWTRLITTMRGMAMPKNPDSGQDDEEAAYQRWKKGGVNESNPNRRMRFVRRQAEADMAEAEAEEAANGVNG